MKPDLEFRKLIERILEQKEMNDNFLVEIGLTKEQINESNVNNLMDYYANELIKLYDKVFSDGQGNIETVISILRMTFNQIKYIIGEYAIGDKK